MKPLYVLLGSFVLTSLVLLFIHKEVDYRLAARVAMAIMLTFTAIGHFAFAKGMTAMVPSFIPFKVEMVWATGFLEIIFGIGLLIPQLKTLTGWLLIVFFLLILPANIKAAMEQINYQTGELNGPGLSYLWFRIPLQALFIAWVFLSTLKK